MEGFHESVPRERGRKEGRGMRKVAREGGRKEMSKRGSQREKKGRKKKTVEVGGAEREDNELI